MHIAIIMDGNGRWAKKRGLKRIEGHKKGAETVRKITEYCAQNDEISYLTLYAFSTENWKRPKMEVEFLMKLLENYLEKELETYIKNDIRFETIGDISKFSDKLKKRIELTKEKTKNNKKLTQILALNYGSKNEITRAVKKLIDKNEEITEENIQNNLDISRDVDLLIRTSGEIRLSNFLLWQCAYAEMFFTNTLWPDFTPEELDKIIKSFHLRERRFGGI
ncbi:di-trans,poly-cis-decaprenylcistransferase [Nautilia sp. PV-1]|uniref:di-trans,poly-cis-decaprenylcistransferase n=1 Tax=Nautilia sp. PV-1 TaxID=2579250 RepID=UPI000FDB7A30|nr:di-trans,poly-cis-decaprenylcistransferase [Nautilia sp. PV-1]AZV46833.1 di-trans,poly-cis-decaprenylcistransferase [Nautilia sp. PV-1]